MLHVQIIAASPASRRGLAAMLAGPDVGVTGMFTTVQEWAVRASPAEVDVIVLAEGSEWPQVNRLADPRRGLVVLSPLDPAGITSVRHGAAGAQRAGWRGWAILDERSEADELSAAVAATAAGLCVLAPALAAALLPASQPDQFEPLPLTPREQAVLECVSRGLPNKAIAARLEISESTVKFHLTACFEKLGASSRAEAVSIAARSGLITL